MKSKTTEQHCVIDNLVNVPPVLSTEFSQQNVSHKSRVQEEGRNFTEKLKDRKSGLSHHHSLRRRAETNQVSHALLNYLLGTSQDIFGAVLL